MKKLLSLFFVLGIMFMIGGVFADDVGQGGEGTVGLDTSVTFNPNPLNFDTIVAGEAKSLANQIIGTDSHLEIDAITVTPSEEGGIFNNENVLFSMTDDNFNAGSVFTATPIEIPVSGTVDFYVQMNVPSATPTGAFSGTITYTIMEYVSS